MPMKVDVTTSYLEMTAPGDLIPKQSPRSDVTIARVEAPMPELNRFFYTAVGGDWYWLDRLPWTYPQWLAYLNRPELETWVLSVAGVPAGYCELETQRAGDVEIVYFGLLPAFIGQGLGSHLLTGAIERGWALGRGASGCIPARSIIPTHWRITSREAFVSIVRRRPPRKCRLSRLVPGPARIQSASTPADSSDGRSGIALGDRRWILSMKFKLRVCSSVA